MSEKSFEGVTLFSSDPLDDDVAYPETGWQAWTTTLGAALVQFATFGYVSSVGVYQDYYVREYLTDYTPSTISWIGGVQGALILGCGIVTGRAFDRGYFYHLMIGGTILHAFSSFMLSLSHKNQYYQIFLSQGVGEGLGAGLMYIPSLSIVSHYFLHRRPLAIGIVSAGAGLGAVIHPIMLNQLFHASVGFHNGVRVSAGLNTGLLIIAILLMRTRLPPKKTGPMIPVLEYLRDLPYLLVLISSFLATLGFIFPIFYLQFYAIGHGVDEEFAFYCLSIMNATSIIGRTLPGLFTPVFGVLNLLIFVNVSMFIIMYCLGVVTSTASIAVWASVFGIFAGGALSLMPATLASLAKDRSEIGGRIGISYGFSAISVLIASPILGAILTSEFRWWDAVIFAASTLAAGTCFLFAARFLLVRQNGTQVL